MGEFESGNTGPANPAQRAGVLALMDDFIFQIFAIRKVILIVFASSIILGPPSIVLSLYLFTHPSFDETLDAEDNFGEVLEVLLSSTIIISTISLVFGIKQYKSIGSWDKKFKAYLKNQQELEDKIMLDYGMPMGEDE